MLHDDETHIHVTLSTICETISFTGTELASGSACDAFVPARRCKLRDHLTNHGPFFFLLKIFNI